MTAAAPQAGATFGAVLTAELARRDWSQGECARRAGVGESYVSRLCSNDRHPSRRMVAALVDALGPCCGPGAFYHAAGYLAPAELADLGVVA